MPVKIGSSSSSKIYVGSSLVQRIYIGSTIVYQNADIELPFTDVGTGSGNLNLGVIANARLRIVPGTYTDVSWDKATNCVINATGVVLVNNGINFRDSTNVEFYGVKITDSIYRAVNIRGLNTGLNIHDCEFKNIGDGVINFEYNERWDGTNATVNINSTVQNCIFDNTSSAISCNGGFDWSVDNKVRGLTRGFKVLNNTFKNSPQIGNCVNLQMAEDCEVAYNIVDNVNTAHIPPPNGGHTGMFCITGSGVLHHNKATNYQGNITRFWGFTIGTAKKKVIIHNNYGYNTWKYGLIEIQNPPFLVEAVEANPTIYTYANYEVYNNSGGDFNRSLDWEGQMLDLYTIYGDLKYYNNVGYRMNRVVSGTTQYSGITNMINYNGGPLTMDEHDNYYFPLKVDAFAFMDANPQYGSSIRD